ncbi:MAG: hypothetical protein H6742_17345 [Alphaproteobacteria bacterium]|nr:hypothetical protein [Alphaproteobacteria bacterium]
MSRERLAALREEVARAVEDGHAPRALLQQLAGQDVMALAEVVVGPRAAPSPLLVSAALEVLPALEEAIAPKALYQRLVALAVETRAEVLTAAAERHPLADWLVPLSRKVEGTAAGTVHLRAVADHPAFERCCQAHAEAGHREGLVATAAALGRPEPAAMLALAGDADGAAEAVVRTLERAPDSAVVAWVGAAWGPGLDPLLARTVQHLRDGATAAALAPWLDGWPRAGGLLAAVRRAL